MSQSSSNSSSTNRKNNKPAPQLPQQQPTPKNNKPQTLSPPKNNMAGANSQSGLNNQVNNMTTSSSNTNKKNNQLPKSRFQQLVNGVAGTKKRFFKSLTTPIEKEYNVSAAGMVPVGQYRNEIITQEKDKVAKLEAAKTAGVAFDENMEPIYPALELDDYLRGRYRIKAEEFKKLQESQGFYFSDSLNAEALDRARSSEGLFLMGVNPYSLLDTISNLSGGVPILDKEGNPVKVPPGDIFSSGRTMELFGEAVNYDANNVYRDQMGYRLGAYRPVKPEDIITKDTPFDNIIRESSKYTQASYERISPASMLNLVRVLDNYSKYELQWLRAATAIEIIYKYMANGATREQFFKSTAKFTEESLLELEEFFKTDHLFMTLDELHEFKKDLEFYRGDKHNSRVVKANKAAGITK